MSSSKNTPDIQNIDISCPVVPVFVCRTNGIFVPHKKTKRRTYLAQIKYTGLERLGHVIGKQQTKTAKKSFGSTGEFGRKMGRPRPRWLKDVENGLLGLKLKKWKGKATNKKNGHLS